MLWLASVLTAGVMAAGLLYLAGPAWGRALERTEPDATCEATPAVHRTGDDESDEVDRSDGEAVSHDEPAAEAAAPAVPEQSETAERGAVTVVDLGIEEASLKDALRSQQELAAARGQQVVVMLTGRRCRPCRGVDAALSDPQMQSALAGVRLVRVDIEAFREDIDGLGMARDIYPAFLLLGPDHSPRDTIHGGEWGDDVADNIAPVLGDFVRGRYHDRRYQRPPTLRSLRL